MGYDNLVRVCIQEAPWYRVGMDFTDETNEILERECVRMREVYKRLRAESDDFPPFGKKYRGSWDVESVVPFTREFPEFTFRVFFFTFDLLNLDVCDIHGEQVTKVAFFNFEKFSMPREFTDVGLEFGMVGRRTFCLDREITDEITGKCRIGFDGAMGW